MTPVDVQVYQFFVMVLAGVVLGIVFDVYRTFRHIARPGAILTAIHDTVFWLFATFLVLAAVFYASWGEVRAYVFVGAVTGALIYFRLASPLVLRFVHWLFRVIARFIRFISRVFGLLVLTPLRFVLLVVARVVATLLLPIWAGVMMVFGLITRLMSEPKKPPTES